MLTESKKNLNVKIMQKFNLHSLEQNQALQISADLVMALFFFRQMRVDFEICSVPCCQKEMISQETKWDC